jgi:hypothetical protein
LIRFSNRCAVSEPGPSRSREFRRALAGPPGSGRGSKGGQEKKWAVKKVGAGIEATCRSSWGRTMTSWGGFVAGPICPWATRGVDGQGSGQTWNFFELVILFWNCWGKNTD